jgi:hypothetical protein
VGAGEVTEMNPEAEAWRIVLGGNSPHLEALTAELSFDPTKQPERMNSTTGDLRDCKNVAKRLFPSGSESVLVIPAGEHDRLKNAPNYCGLPQFVADIESHFQGIIV